MCRLYLAVADDPPTAAAVAVRRAWEARVRAAGPLYAEGYLWGCSRSEGVLTKVRWRGEAPPQRPGVRGEPGAVRRGTGRAGRRAFLNGDNRDD